MVKAGFRRGKGETAMPRRKKNGSDDPLPVRKAEAPQRCWLCGRMLGRRVEWHHPIPKSRGGRETVPVHPICHRTIHARFSNAELARLEAGGTGLAQDPAIARFVSWVAAKPPDFNAPTRKAQ
jgi:hypothetical protein